MIAVTSTISLSSHHRSPILPDHVRPARSIPALPSSTVARAHVGSPPTHCRYPGSSTRSCGHHVTIAQPRVMKAASSAVHLVGRHGFLGVPTPVSCYSCFLYIIDVPFQALGPVDPHPPSFPIRRLVVCVPVPYPSCRLLSPSCGQPP